MRRAGEEVTRGGEGVGVAYDAVKDQEDKPTHHHFFPFFFAVFEKLVP